MTNTNYRGKMRAVFLAAIMVVSVFGASMAFTGSAAAAAASAGSTDIEASNIAFDDDDASQAFRITTTDANVEGDSTGATNEEIVDQTIAVTGINAQVADAWDNADSDDISVEASGPDSSNIDISNVEVFDPATPFGPTGTPAVAFDVSVADADTVQGQHAFTISADGLDTTADDDPIDPGNLGNVATYSTSGPGTGVGSDNLIENGETSDAYFGVPSDNVEKLDDGDRGFSGKSFMITDNTQVEDTGAGTTVGTSSGVVSGVANFDSAVLRNLDDDREINNLESELTIDSFDGVSYIEVDTSGLETGEYAVVLDNNAGDNNLAVGDSVGNRDFNADEYGILLEVAEQSLTAEWEESSYDDSDNDAELNLDSSRAGYNVEISADGLGYEELESLFDVNDVPSVERGDEPRFDQRSGDDVITVAAADPLTADFAAAELDPDNYEFEVSVTDADVSDTAAIDVNEEDKDGEFSEGVYQTAAGDFTEFSLDLESTSEAFIQIGDEDAGFVDIVHIEDDNDDNNVSFMVNTRLLGSPGEPTADVYYSENDEIHASALHSGSLDYGEIDNNADVGGTDTIFTADGGDSGLVPGGTAPAGTSPFDAYLDQLGLIDFDDGETAANQLTRPPQPAEYEVSAGVVDDDGVVFDGEDETSSTTEQLDSSLLELQTPALGSVTTHVAPQEAADEDDSVEDLLEVVTEREDVAIDDRLIVQVEATGLYGTMGATAADQGSSLGADDNGFAILEDGTTAQTLGAVNDLNGEGIEFTLEAGAGTGNQQATELDLGSDDSTETLVLVDQDTGQFFVVVDTSNDGAWSNGEPADGATYSASLEYTTDGSELYNFDELRGTGTTFPSDAFDGAAENSGSDADDAYPYFGSDSDAEANGQFDFQTASIDFDNLDESDVLQVQGAEDAEISGTTNVAPGSDAEIRITSTDASTSFRNGNDVNITSDGGVTTSFDLSEQEVGDQFETSLRVSASTIDTTDSVVVEAIGGSGEETNETDTNETDTDDGEDMDDGEEPADDGETNETTDDGGESTDDGTPGFGAVVALIALIGAALLAVRRQN